MRVIHVSVASPAAEGQAVVDANVGAIERCASLSLRSPRRLEDGEKSKS
jgi:hypothetical protein